MFWKYANYTDLVLHVIIFTDSHDMDMISVGSMHNCCLLMVELENVSLSCCLISFHKHPLYKGYIHL